LRRGLHRADSGPYGGGEVEAAGWMLCAVQERLSEKDLPDWESLKIIGDKDAALLPSQQRDIH